jgi:hypothetical protein
MAPPLDTPEASNLIARRSGSLGDAVDAVDAVVQLGDRQLS